MADILKNLLSSTRRSFAVTGYLLIVWVPALSHVVIHTRAKKLLPPCRIVGARIVQSVAHWGRDVVIYVTLAITVVMPPWHVPDWHQGPF
jgi:hypothetical protein